MRQPAFSFAFFYTRISYPITLRVTTKTPKISPQKIISEPLNVVCEGIAGIGVAPIVDLQVYCLEEEWKYHVAKALRE